MENTVADETVDTGYIFVHHSFIEADGTEQTMFAYKGIPKYLNFYMVTQVMRRGDRAFLRVYHKINNVFQMIEMNKLKNKFGGLKPGQMLLLELDPSYELKVTIEQYRGKFRRFSLEVEEDWNGVNPNKRPSTTDSPKKEGTSK